MKRNLHRKTQNMLENLAKVFDTMETSKNSKNRDNQQGQIEKLDEDPIPIPGQYGDFYFSDYLLLVKKINELTDIVNKLNKPSETTNEHPLPGKQKYLCIRSKKDSKNRIIFIKDHIYFGSDRYYSRFNDKINHDYATLQNELGKNQRYRTDNFFIKIKG